tara:strand:- start:3395 stop:3802 length:408 start_codon:yes stop_codon:yes gene_type:complete
MSIFNAFIQTEMPLRPYLPADVPQNSVIIRKGNGPRELAGVRLLPGQILMNVDGTIAAVNLADVTGNTDNHIHVQETPSVSWVVTHGNATADFVCSVYDENGRPVVYDDIEIVDENRFNILFVEPSKGKAVVLTV